MKRWRHVWSWIALCLATTLFSGFLPGQIVRKRGVMGGTMGALVALIIQILFVFRSVTWPYPVAITVGTFLLGLVVIEPAERLLFLTTGPRLRHTGSVVAADFNETNIDEVHGQCLAGLPIWFMAGSVQAKLVALAVAFITFRVFDSQKPWPIDAIERRFEGSSFGIMFDDTVAALPAFGAAAAAVFLLS